jgi:hypothetical protein
MNATATIAPTNKKQIVASVASMIVCIGNSPFRCFYVVTVAWRFSMSSFVLRFWVIWVKKLAKWRGEIANV